MTIYHVERVTYRNDNDIPKFIEATDMAQWIDNFSSAMEAMRKLQDGPIYKVHRNSFLYIDSNTYSWRSVFDPLKLPAFAARANAWSNYIFDYTYGGVAHLCFNKESQEPIAVAFYGIIEEVF